MGELYAIEETIRGKPPDERLRNPTAARRAEAQSAVAMDAGALSMVSPKSALAKAILYSAKRWTALTCYGDDGRIEIDNSAAERGRKRPASPPLIVAL